MMIAVAMVIVVFAIAVYGMTAPQPWEHATGCDCGECAKRAATHRR